MALGQGKRAQYGKRATIMRDRWMLGDQVPWMLVLLEGGSGRVPAGVWMKRNQSSAVPGQGSMT